MLEEADILAFRNPHGDPCGGEYRVRYQDAAAGLAAAIAQAPGAVPTPASIPIPAPLPKPDARLAGAAHQAAAVPSGISPQVSAPVPQAAAATTIPATDGAAAQDGGAEELSPLEEEPEEDPPMPTPRGSAAKPPLPASAQVPVQQPQVSTIPLGRVGTGGGGPGPLSPVSEKAEEAKAPAPEAPRRGSDAATSGAPMEMYAEPLSPLSEVSEVSAPDEPQMPSAMPPIPGMPGLSPLLPMGPGTVPFTSGMPPPGLPGGMPLMPYMVGAPGGQLPLVNLQSLQGTSKAAGGPPSPPVVLTIQSELVGMLIGKGGETVKQISKDSGARIEISKTANDGPNSERSVYLSGAQECIDKAKALIEETLSKSRERGGLNNPNAASLKVPHELVGMLIGKGGETIKELKKESGARIDIAKEAADTNTTDRLVHLSGPPECVEYAKKMIEDMLGRARERIGGVGGSGGERESLALEDGSSRDTATQAIIQVQHELIGMLIGKGGETIKMISKDSGARIEINKDEGSTEGSRTVYIWGAPEQITRAKNMIEDTLSRSREHQGDTRLRARSRSRGRSRSRSRGIGPRVIRVPPELIGMLIGRGGETIKAISNDSGARIEISKEERDGDRAVTIGGSEDAIRRAQDAIDDVLRQGRLRDQERRGGCHGNYLPITAPSDDGADFERFSRTSLKDSWLQDKIYIDECDMPHRPNFLPEHEDGLPSDLEVFVRGFSKASTERDLWEHLYRMGATDVKEILLLRRQKQSKGMAYVVFNRHDHAVLAKQKLNGTPATSIPCNGALPSPEDAPGTLLVRLSESERCINIHANVYGADMVGMILGHRGKFMQDILDASELRQVVLTGRSMKCFGQVDEDPRLHIVVWYEPDEGTNVDKAIRIWSDQLSAVHRDVVDRAKGKGKGKDFPYFDPWGHPPPIPHPDFAHRPPFAPDVPVEAPVLLQRRRIPAAGQEGTVGPKVVEATCLKGRELRWQSWPEVSKFNEDWHVLPMRWGLRGELFVLLRRRATGETRVCAAEVQMPLDKWPVLSSAQVAGELSSATRYKSFTFNEHLFLISIDRISGCLKVYHVPDPSSPWDVAFEMSLPAEADPEADQAFHMSRGAKLCVFYTMERLPYVIVQEPKAGYTRLYKISDPGKAWTRCATTPPVSAKVRLLPIYTKTKTGPPNEFEASVFAIDPAANELTVYSVPRDPDQVWLQVSTMPFVGDTRLSCIYVPGKPEPLLMAGSPTERQQKLCHLNLSEWILAKKDERREAPKAPVVEEKFSRPMSSLWPPESRGNEDPEMMVALPKDCTADLPVSRHAWVSVPIGGVVEHQPGAHGHPPPMPPPYDPRYPYPHVPPPFDPRGPPPFDYRPPPFGRPAFDTPPLPYDKGKGKGFDPHRPPFDHAPPPHFDGKGGPLPPYPRPPFDDPHRPPPFDVGKGKGVPFDGKGSPFDGKGPPPPPFDGKGAPAFDGKGPPPPFDPHQPPGKGGHPPVPGGHRAPFDAPPGDWFGASNPPAPSQQDGPDRPPADRQQAAGAPFPAGGPEVGTMVEANFRDRNWWSRAKIMAKHNDGTVDVQYDGDYMEWNVPPARIRPVGAGPPPPLGSAPLGAPPAVGGEERERRHRRHRHRRGEEGGAEGEGRERRRRRESGTANGPLVGDADAVPPPAAPPPTATEGPPPDAAPPAEPRDADPPQPEERERRRRRRSDNPEGGEAPGGEGGEQTEDRERRGRRRRRRGEGGGAEERDGAAAPDPHPA